MNFSFTRDTGDGIKTTFTMSFAGQDEGYLNASNIHVYVNGTEVPFTINPSDPNKVYLSAAPASGADVLIRRIMPKNVPYSDFKNGNPFSQDTLNYTQLQQLYVTQELLDGFLPYGFYFKQDVNMGGHNIKNLGDAVDPDDAVKKKVTDDLINRVSSLEDNLDDIASRTAPWRMVAAGGETEIAPPYHFTTALIAINGVLQTLGDGYAYKVEDNQIKLAEPLRAGDEVFALIGSYPAEPVDAVSADEVGLLYAAFSSGTPIGQTFLARVGEKVTNAKAFFDGSNVYTSPVPLTGTITAINWPDITIV